MRINFRRIISKGAFIPEIDGLRFIAIASVVLFHLNAFLLEKDLNTYNEVYQFDFLNILLSRGDLGVPLFFVISGFILALPFANMYLNNGTRIKLKNFFLRRLTRLEPPYILIMTALLFGSVYIAKTISLEDGVISYLSSITYSHNFIYERGTLPLLNAVAWSLEIEIQFYILTPLLAMVFLLKNNHIRRMIIISVALLFLILDLFELFPFISIINYLEYFFAGFLLADLYACKSTLFKKSKLDGILSLLFLSIIWLFDKDELAPSMKIIWEVVQLTSIFALYYLVIFHRSLKLLTNPIITNIGGMCYTIYLLHYPLISLFGNQLMGFSFSNNSILNTGAYTMVLLSVILIVSSVYYLLVERPCRKSVV